jgi:predicted short-subunit dehydrogenase-like oxidoreductase (DUF2520 family)
MTPIQNISVSFIGAGNLATNLARALWRAGICIRQVYSRTEAAARELAEQIHAQPVTDLSAVSGEVDVCFVCLTDAALIELLPQIVKGKEETLLVHTAGSVSMSVWEGYALRYGVFYPLQTFSKQRETDFTRLPIFLESNSPTDTERLQQIASLLTERVFLTDSAGRRSLHLAAVFACNFSNHLYGVAAKILKEHELPFDALLPLIDETAAKVHRLSPDEAQTGPAARRDMETIMKHEEILSVHPEWRKLYELLTESILRKH